MSSICFYSYVKFLKCQYQSSKLSSTSITKLCYVCYVCMQMLRSRQSPRLYPLGVQSVLSILDFVWTCLLLLIHLYQYSRALHPPVLVGITLCWGYGNKLLVLLYVVCKHIKSLKNLRKNPRDNRKPKKTTVLHVIDNVSLDFLRERVWLTLSLTYRLNIIINHLIFSQ